MKQTIEQAVASVQNAPGSMYTREDVISLLNKIETKSSSGTLSKEQITRLIEEVVERVQSDAGNLDSDDVVDSSSVEFTINYGNTVEIQSLDIDTDKIAEEVSSGIADAIEEFFEELEKEETSEEEVEES